jgi:hypothetical protein
MYHLTQQPVIIKGPQTLAKYKEILQNIKLLYPSQHGVSNKTIYIGKYYNHNCYISCFKYCDYKTYDKNHQFCNYNEQLLYEQDVYAKIIEHQRDNPSDNSFVRVYALLKIPYNFLLSIISDEEMQRNLGYQGTINTELINELKKYIDDNRCFACLTITEDFRGESFSSFLTNVVNWNISIDIIKLAFLSLFKSIYVMNSIGILHNDLHTGNIIIEANFGLISSNHIPRVSIFDFDRSILSGSENKCLTNSFFRFGLHRISYDDILKSSVDTWCIIISCIIILKNLSNTNGYTITNRLVYDYLFRILLNENEVYKQIMENMIAKKYPSSKHLEGKVFKKYIKNIDENTFTLLNYDYSVIEYTGDIKPPIPSGIKGYYYTLLNYFLPIENEDDDGNEIISFIQFFSEKNGWYDYDKLYKIFDENGQRYIIIQYGNGQVKYTLPLLNVIHHTQNCTYFNPIECEIPQYEELYPDVILDRINKDLRIIASLKKYNKQRLKFLKLK